MKSFKEFDEATKSKFSKGDVVTVKNANKYDSLSPKTLKGVVDMVNPNGTINVSVKNGSMSVDAKDLLKEAKTSYEIYHDSMSNAFTEVEKELKKTGFAIEDESRWNDVATGPAKPGRGKTNRYTLTLVDKNGKESKKKLHIQIYNRESKSKTFELNMYVN